MRRKQMMIALGAGLIAGAAPLFLALASFAEPPITAEALSEAVGNLATQEEARHRISQYLQQHSTRKAVTLTLFGLFEVAAVAGYVLFATGSSAPTEQP